MIDIGYFESIKQGKDEQKWKCWLKYEQNGHDIQLFELWLVDTQVWQPTRAEY